jgi:Tfp pilus assembly protein PilF
MKWIFVVAALLAALAGAPAAGMDDQYVEIYNLIQEGDAFAADQPREAVVKYGQAQLLLQRLQKGSPDWNPTVVNFRLKYLDQKLTALAAAGPASQVGRTPAPGETQTPAGALAKTTDPIAAAAEVEALRAKVLALEADKGLLEAKLREALGAVPAALDPAALTRATEKIKELQKENELLKAHVELEKKPGSADAPSPEQLRKALDEANRKLATESERTRLLAETNQFLQGQLGGDGKAAVDNLEVAALRSALETANSQLAQQRQSAARVAQDAAASPPTAQQVPGASDKTAALAMENELLKKQLEEARRAPLSPANGELANQLAQARAQIALLQSDQEVLRAQLKSSGPEATNLPLASALPATPKQAARIRQLEQERDDFERQLKAANKEVSARKYRVPAERIAKLEQELAASRARLDAMEARAVPFTPEELALFSKPAAPLSAAATKPAAEAGSPPVTKLATDAQRQAAASVEMQKVASTLPQATPTAVSDLHALSVQAATQVSQNRLEEAEKTLEQALAIAPNDPASLAVMGSLKQLQGKADEAVEILSRAAAANPKNAEIQNSLGLSLSQKGLRGPAETALRRAIQLQPNYGSAHYNLAVVYLSQQPPMVELARWHYQKALGAGQKHNADFEKKLEALTLPK